MFYLSSLQLVYHLQHCAEDHMHEGDDHTDLHFEGVFKIESVLCDSPLAVDDSKMFPKNDLHAEEFIVYETAVTAHEPHKIEDWP